MVIKAARFTPEVLLCAPRRSAGVPNCSGQYVLYTTSTYDFEQHKKTDSLVILDRLSGESMESRWTATDFTWLDEHLFMALQPKDDGTEVWIGHITSKSHTLVLSSETQRHIDAPASNLRVSRINENEWAVVVSAEAAPDGSLYNAKTAKHLHSTGRLYDATYVRHWDRYETNEKNSLWYAKFTRKAYHTGYAFILSDFTNALKAAHLECPIRPFGGTDHFDVSSNRIIFVSRDPKLKPALSTKNNVYILTIDSWEEPPKSLEKIDIGGGAKTCPVFSPDGSRAAFLSMRTDGYESDQNSIYVMSDIQVASTPRALTFADREFWELSPSSVRWTTDGRSLLTIAEDGGRSKLFLLPVDSYDKIEPKVLTQSDSVSEAQQLPSGYIFTSGSSLIDNSIYKFIDPQDGDVAWVDSNSVQGSRFGLRKDQIESIWTPASNPDVNKLVHSWVVRPSSYKKGEKYPVAYLIHGGPQGSWNDSWSTRWNPAVFAEQGYIVVCPNPTGSTGYGQAFTDAINKNWGGDPYQDIVNTFDWVGGHLEGADNDRAVALGGSYGGYMMNWIQGHDLGRKFKALVNHDGIFSTVGMLATDELYFPFQDLGGTPFYDPKAKANMYQSWRKWDPTEHLDKWETPMLVIHSAKDFRIAIADGLATFNVLQARGVPSQFLTFPDENHWVLKPENSLVWHKTVFNWINKYVGLPEYAEQDDVSFFGGVKEDDSARAEMPTQGKPEM